MRRFNGPFSAEAELNAVAKLGATAAAAAADVRPPVPLGQLTMPPPMKGASRALEPVKGDGALDNARPLPFSDATRRPSPDAELSRPWAAMTVVELRSLLRELGLVVGGRKGELVARLSAYFGR